MYSVTIPRRTAQAIACLVIPKVSAHCACVMVRPAAVMRRLLLRLLACAWYVAHRQLSGA